MNVCNNLSCKEQAKRVQETSATLELLINMARSNITNPPFDIMPIIIINKHGGVKKFGDVCAMLLILYLERFS